MCNKLSGFGNKNHFIYSQAWGSAVWTGFLPGIPHVVAVSGLTVAGCFQMNSLACLKINTGCRLDLCLQHLQDSSSLYSLRAARKWEWKVQGPLGSGLAVVHHFCCTLLVKTCPDSRAGKIDSISWWELQRILGHLKSTMPFQLSIIKLKTTPKLSGLQQHFFCSQIFNLGRIWWGRDHLYSTQHQLEWIQGGGLQWSEAPSLTCLGADAGYQWGERDRET